MLAHESKKPVLEVAKESRNVRQIQSLKTATHEAHETLDGFMLGVLRQVRMNQSFVVPEKLTQKSE